jgi:hypothetical protein
MKHCCFLSRLCGERHALPSPPVVWVSATEGFGPALLDLNTDRAWRDQSLIGTLATNDEATKHGVQYLCVGGWLVEGLFSGGISFGST